MSFTEDEPSDEDVEAEPEEPVGGGLDSMSDAMSHESPSDAGSSHSNKPGKSSKLSVASVESHGTKEDSRPLDELTSSATQARTETVPKVLEGLRDEAFELARDIGLDVLAQPGGLRDFCQQFVSHCFPPCQGRSL